MWLLGQWHKKQIILPYQCRRLNPPQHQHQSGYWQNSIILSLKMRSLGPRALRRDGKSSLSQVPSCVASSSRPRFLGWTYSWGSDNSGGMGIMSMSTDSLIRMPAAVIVSVIEGVTGVGETRGADAGKPPLLTVITCVFVGETLEAANSVPPCWWTPWVW